MEGEATISASRSCRGLRVPVGAARLYIYIYMFRFFSVSAYLLIKSGHYGASLGRVSLRVLNIAYGESMCRCPVRMLKLRSHCLLVV